MTNKKSTKKGVGKTATITPQDIRHFVGDTEVATIPEMIARMGGKTTASVRGEYVYNTLHTQRNTLLPKPEVYGTAYLYPVEQLKEAILKVQATLAGKAVRKDADVERLLSKIEGKPELAKILLGLLD